MKFTLAICAVIMAGTTNVVASPAPAADPWCKYIGEPCSKVKRAAEAVANAFAEPKAAPAPVAEAEAEAWCHYIGEPCSKAKRDQEVEAFCHLADGPCTKAKRAAEALASAVSGADVIPAAYFEALQLRDAFPAPVASPEADAEAEAWCKYIGEPCSKIKRDAEAWCHYIGEPCSKVKRAAEAIAEALAEPKADAEAEAWCHYIGEPCSKAKRDASAIADAAAEALASL